MPSKPKSTAIIVGAVLIVVIAVTYVSLGFRKHIAGLVGPPPVKLKESYSENPEGPDFDHSLLDDVLRAHVDKRGLVDYAALKKDPERLDRYIKSLARAPFDELGRDEKLALLINAYNAFTLRLILDHYPVDSIRDIPSRQRWDAERWMVGKHQWSLNQIEHEQIRPHFAEPRIHFALVCAAIGCPILRRDAYKAETLDMLLEDQTKYVHSRPRWFRYEDGSDVVYLTRLYDWYGGDFEQTAGSVSKFAAQYSPALKTALADGVELEIEWLEYDWTLNDQKNAEMLK